MGDNKSSQPKSYPLDILKRLLDTPQLLPHESSKEFLQLFASFEDYGKPQNSRDYLVVHQATVLAWDIMRCQGMKVGVLRSHQRPALESLLRKSKFALRQRRGSLRWLRNRRHVSLRRRGSRTPPPDRL
jgi:hypothetical protein